MNKKLFNIIYALIARGEIQSDEAYEILRDYFRLNEVACKEKKDPDFTITPEEAKEHLIDAPVYPASIRHLYDPSISPVYTYGHSVMSSAANGASFSTDGSSSITSVACPNGSVTLTSEASAQATDGVIDNRGTVAYRGIPLPINLPSKDGDTDEK